MLLLQCLGAVLVVYILTATLLDAYGHRTAADEDFDAIIVAGCPVRADGRPTETLRRRVDKAVSLWVEKRAPVIVFTGGMGVSPPEEARAAAHYAQESLGLPPEAILMELHSQNTLDNARLSASLFPFIQQIIVVSDSYHIFRAECIFGRYFSRVCGAGVTPPSWTRLKFSLREVGALLVYFWKIITIRSDSVHE